MTATNAPKQVPFKPMRLQLRKRKIIKLSMKHAKARKQLTK